MNNTLSFDIVNTHTDQPRVFSVKFDGQVVLTRQTITAQETVMIEFTDAPGEHLLELVLLDTPTSLAQIVVGNFKINHHECVDSRIKSLFQGETVFTGMLKGLVKFKLLINTPVLAWQQKTRIY